MPGTCTETLEKAPPKKSSLCQGLPDSKAKRIAHPYALVVVQNRGKEAVDIWDALNVLLKHTREQHNNCPQANPPGATIRIRLLAL